MLTCVDREEVTKEDNYEVSGDVEEDEEEWNPVQDWENENDDAEDVQDESTAYLEFLNEEVLMSLLHFTHSYICRPRSSTISQTTTTSWRKIIYLTRPSRDLSRTAC
jgi:hypothetical protein